MTTEDKIKTTLEEMYSSDETFITTVRAIVGAITKKYSDIDELKIKESLGKMDGWKRVGDGLEDKAEISPSFFE